MGGLIGRFYETDNKEYVIANCVVGSSNSTLSLKATANPDPGDKIMVVAGGLVGNIECSGITKITNCSVIGDGNSILQGTDSAAGMIGYANTYTKNGKMIYYDTCTVDGLRLRGYLRVAGVEGKRNYDIPNAYPWEVVSTFYNVQVTNCEGYVYNLNEVYNEAGDANEIASGGLVAYSRGRVNAVNCNISNVHLKGDDVYASGGVTGRTGGTFGSVRVANTSITDCTLMGACVGGIAGRVDASLGEGVTTASKINIKNNKILSYYTSEKTKYNTLHEQFAGGMYGFWKNVSYYNIMGDNVLIENNLIGMLPIKTNTILKYNYVGGIGGLINCVVKMKTVELNNNIISILDKEAILGAASSANVPIVDYLSSSDFGIWSLDGEGNKKVAADKVETVYPVLFDSVNKKLDSYREFENQNELLPYIQTVGLMFGRMTEKHDKMARLTDVKVSYDEEIRIYRPAIDVGTTDNSNLHGTKYRYQIVYGENKDQKSLIDETGVDHESIPNAMGMNGEYYQFGDLLGLWDYYQKETDKKYTYRLDPDSKGNYYHGTLKNVKTSIEEILSGTYYDEEEKYRSIYTNAEGDVIPMLVYDNNESLDVVINTVLNVLTNAGGNLKENNMINGNFASVTPIKMEVKDGVVSQSENGSLQPSIIATNVKNSTVDLTVNSLGYDEQTDSKNGTFTVLRVKYCWKYSSGSNAIIYNAAGDKYVTDDTCEMIVDIPIYLERVLEYQTHFTGVLGSEYYLDNLLTNGKNNLLTLKDTYTAYVEYVYNDAYDKYNSKMTKEICYKRTLAAGYETISKGTKFILIDLNNNGHAYYYKVEQDTQSVPFGAFQDANGNSYQEIPISLMNSISSENMDNTLYEMHENDEHKSMPSSYYAMQQYIILVDSSEIISEVENYAYQFVVQPIKNENEVLLRRSIEKKCPEACKLEITEYQGLSGSFDEENTKIEGEISPESSVTIDLDYTISAPTAYWNYLSANKDSTLAQYLDVAIYLEQNGNRVALPSGTQVVFTKGDETIVGVMQGNTILYQYKDSGKVYDLNELSMNTRIQGTIELDFSSADFSTFNSGEYNVVLELLKTKDAQFPMGGDVLDSYQLTVNSITKKNLGFAIEPEDLLTLGMNGYLPEESDRGIIDCDVRIDFSDYFNMLGIPTSEMNALEQKYFTVEFTLEKKVKGNNGILRYEPYDGDLVKLYFGDSQKANLENYNGSKVVYKFAENYIRSSQREEKYVVSFPYTVKVDVDGLVEAYDDITNYRVVANLYLSDGMPSGTAANLAEEATEGCEIYVSPNATIPGGAESMEDFFVFTIAKIKTDLDVTK